MTTAPLNLSSTGPHNHAEWQLALDEKLYNPSSQAIEFFKEETGISNDAELKKHVVAIQKKAFSVRHRDFSDLQFENLRSTKVCKYPCIRVFEFMTLKMANVSAYDLVLKLGRERKDAIFVDLGCCCKSKPY